VVGVQEMGLPQGRDRDLVPRVVAPDLSIVSVPLPCLEITFRDGAASITSGLVCPQRTMMPVQVGARGAVGHQDVPWRGSPVLPSFP
jgi:hypothetical protein